MTDAPRDPDPKLQSAPKDSLRELTSRELLQGQREVLIRHGEEVYRLSLTRSGKLILRK